MHLFRGEGEKRRKDITDSGKVVQVNIGRIPVRLWDTYLAGKTIALYEVLGAATILGTVVYVNLFELVAIGQGTAGYVHVLLCVLVHAKDK